MQHPDAEILAGFPGIGPATGARVLGEVGDDRARFRDARGLKSCAGSAPTTVASGKSLVVRQRKIKNQRLASVGHVWIFGELPSPQVKEHYDRRRAAGDRHAAAMRNVFNRFLGCLYHCLQTGQTFDPEKAFPTPEAQPEPAAA
jgi:transposase